jgi:hypothetical protein
MGLDLIEVKGSTSLSEHYHHDVALKGTLSRAGYRVRKTFLCHLDRAYVRRGPRPPRLFRLDDITPRSSPCPAIRALAVLFETLEREDAPPIPIGAAVSSRSIVPSRPIVGRDVPKGSASS